MNSNRIAGHARAYIKNVIPAVYDMSTYSVCSMLTGMIASRYLGVTAMSAVSVASPYISLVYAYGLIYGVGASTLVSIHFGKSEKGLANKTFSNIVFFAVFSTLLIGIIAFILVRPLSGLLGATPENGRYVVAYLKVITLSSLPYTLSYCLTVLLKADRHPLWGLIGSTACMVVQLGLMYLLVVVLNWGIYGLAVSSAAAQFIILVLCLVHFCSKRANLRFVSPHWDGKMIARCTSIGIPDALSEGSSGIFVLMYNYFAYRTLGETGVVAFSVINFANLLVVQIMLGITQGMQPLSSYYFGKNDMQSNRLYLKFALFFAGLVSVVMFILCFFFTETVVNWYIEPSAMNEFSVCVYALKRFSFFMLPVGGSIVSIGYFASIQQVKWAQTLSICRGIAAPGLFGLVMSNCLGINGLWLAPSCAELCTLTIACFLYRKRKTL